MLKAESGSFNGNVMNKVGENFRKIKRKQEIEKFDTFMVCLEYNAGLHAHYLTYRIVIT